MTTEIVIRGETDADTGPIADISIAAFSALVISSHTEQFIIAALRAARGRAELSRPPATLPEQPMRSLDKPDEEQTESQPVLAGWPF